MAEEEAHRIEDPATGPSWPDTGVPRADRHGSTRPGQRSPPSTAHRQPELPPWTTHRITTWRITAGALLRLDERLYWNLRASHTRRDSNVVQPSGAPFFDYARTVVSTGFDWSF